MSEMNKGTIPSVPGMEYSHPLYVIPTEFWDSARRAVPCEMIAFHGDGLVRVYAAPDTLADTILVNDDDPEDLRYGDMFRTVYTPNAEEVCRALRGPRGDPGPVGPMGDTGKPGSAAQADMTAMYNRLADAERGTTAAMRAITTLVTTLLNTGVIDADNVLNNDPKEQ